MESWSTRSRRRKPPESIYTPLDMSSKVDSIVEILTEKLYAHDYLITRNEAECMGLKVAKASDKVEEYIWSLFKLYEGFLGIDKEINLAPKQVDESGLSRV